MSFCLVTRLFRLSEENLSHSNRLLDGHAIVRCCVMNQSPGRWWYTVSVALRESSISPPPPPLPGCDDRFSTIPPAPTCTHYIAGSIEALTVEWLQPGFDGIPSINHSATSPPTNYRHDSTNNILLFFFFLLIIFWINLLFELSFFKNSGRLDSGISGRCKLEALEAEEENVGSFVIRSSQAVTWR